VNLKDGKEAFGCVLSNRKGQVEIRNYSAQFGEKFGQWFGDQYEELRKVKG
jgi:hypothetical protein